MKFPPPPITLLPCVPAAAGAPYAEAYNNCAVLPGHALVHVRASLAALTDIWLRLLVRGTGGTLAEQNDRLVRLLGLTRSAGQVFHDVRYAGNLGAHPEQRTGGPPTRLEARDALRQLHGLLALFAERVGGVPRGEIPGFEEPPEVDWGDVCERAIFGHDTAAMVAVGRRLSEGARASREKIEGQARGPRDASAPADLSGFHDSLGWFERAQARAADPEVTRTAAYERARMLIVELPLEERLDEGVALLRWAAVAGHADAQALLALLLLDARSPLPAPRDLEEAREWAERAAHADHPEALNVLTAIYGNGEGVERDPVRALGYARRSSEAGYPLAHANLALLLLDQPRAARDDAEIRALIDRAKREEIGEAYWAEYRLLREEGALDSGVAEQALAVAAEAKVVPALVVRVEHALQAEPRAWDLVAAIDWLVDVLGRVEEGEVRDAARRRLVRVRDEGDRRMRSPAEQSSGPRGNDLFALVIRAGACLGIHPGDDPAACVAAVMRALGRVCSPLPTGQRATQEDVELVHAAIPTFPVRWADGRAVLVAPGGANKSVSEADYSGDPLAHSAPRRPVRNALCSCGSGRKFKGCCGRR